MFIKTLIRTRGRTSDRLLSVNAVRRKKLEDESGRIIATLSALEEERGAPRQASSSSALPPTPTSKSRQSHGTHMAPGLRHRGGKEMSCLASMQSVLDWNRAYLAERALSYIMSHAGQLKIIISILDIREIIQRLLSWSGHFSSQNYFLQYIYDSCKEGGASLRFGNCRLDEPLYYSKKMASADIKGNKSIYLK